MYAIVALLVGYRGAPLKEYTLPGALTSEAYPMPVGSRPDHGLRFGDIGTAGNHNDSGSTGWRFGGQGHIVTPEYLPLMLVSMREMKVTRDTI